MQALWMVLAAFLFASMGVCVKIASDFFNSAELVCYRGLIGMFILWLLSRSQNVTLATRYPGMHAWRSLVGVASLGAWFYAIAHLPLATAMTLNYISSVWIAAFLVGGMYTYTRGGLDQAGVKSSLHWNQFGAMAQYLLSKRTSVYTQVAYQLVGGSATGTPLDGALVPGSPGASSNGHQIVARVALNHTF